MNAPDLSRLMHLVRHGVFQATAVSSLLVATANQAMAQVKQHFDVEEFQVQGNTLLPAVDIEAVVYEFLGPAKTVDDVERARAALEALYAKRGYPTVSAELPAQSAADGVIVLKVTERKLGRLRVTGSHFTSLEAVRQGAPSLTEGSVPNMNDVQRDMLALNQLPARTITPVLRAGRAPDTVDVDLQVEDHLATHASLELNNRQSTDTRPLRLSGTLGYDNLWQRGDSASLFFQVAPQHPADATVYSGSYLFHLPDSNLSLLASYLRSDSDVSTVGATNVVGKGQILGVRLVIPLTLETGFNQSLNVGLDYKDFAQNLTASGATSHVPLRYVPLSATYQAGWTSGRQQTDVTNSFVLGLRGLGSNASAFDANRAYAEANFAYVRSSLTHLHELPNGFQAWARLQGQAAPEPLVPNEEYSFGGQETVRGYRESEALGDTAGSVQLELRSPSLSGAIGEPVNELRLHAFADAGHSSINHPLPEQRQTYTLGSVGSGLRVRILDQFNAAVEEAVVLANGANTKSGANRLLFRMYGDF